VGTPGARFPSRAPPAGMPAGKAGVEALAAKFEVPVGTLLASEAIELTRGELGDADIECLPVLLQTGPRLLDLGYNLLTDAVAAMLAAAVRENAAMRVLRLNNNHFTSAGAITLAAVLQAGGPPLEVLNLDANEIDDAGAVALAEAAAVHGSLRELNLGENAISDAGALGLASALKANSTITDLGLHDNKVGDVGAKAIAEALGLNTTLTTLTLDSNQYTDKAADAFVAALKGNSALRSLGLSHGVTCAPRSTWLRGRLVAHPGTHPAVCPRMAQGEPLVQGGQGPPRVRVGVHGARGERPLLQLLTRQDPCPAPAPAPAPPCLIARLSAATAAPGARAPGRRRPLARRCASPAIECLRTVHVPGRSRGRSTIPGRRPRGLPSGGSRDSGAPPAPCPASGRQQRGSCTSRRSPDATFVPCRTCTHRARPGTLWRSPVIRLTPRTPDVAGCAAGPAPSRRIYGRACGMACLPERDACARVEPALY